MPRLRGFCDSVRNPKTTPIPSRIPSWRVCFIEADIDAGGRGSALLENYSLSTRRVFPLDRLRAKCVTNN